mgnify:CR=1 FL=1
MTETLSKAWSLFDAGNYTDAETIYKECYAKIPSTDHDNYWQVLMGLIYAESFLEHYTEARTYASQLIACAIDHEEKHIAIHQAGMIERMAGAYDKAMNLFLQEEAKEKGIVTLVEIPTVKDAYESQRSFADRMSIWQGDITRLQVGAIVNAANSQMIGCFVPCHRCIDNAIHSAAGVQLRNECNHIMNQRRIRFGRQYEEPTGTATLTSAYNLPCKYVIHTVGPIVYGRLTEALKEDLRNCYRNVLQCCMEHEINSVAFCCISTGEFHFPNDIAAQIAVETTEQFFAQNENCGIERVIFWAFRPEL